MPCLDDFFAYVGRGPRTNRSGFGGDPGQDRRPGFVHQDPEIFLLFIQTKL